MQFFQNRQDSYDDRMVASVLAVSILWIVALCVIVWFYPYIGLALTYVSVGIVIYGLISIGVGLQMCKVTPAERKAAMQKLMWRVYLWPIGIPHLLWSYRQLIIDTFTGN